MTQQAKQAQNHSRTLAERDSLRDRMDRLERDVAKLRENLRSGYVLTCEVCGATCTATTSRDATEAQQATAIMLAAGAFGWRVSVATARRLAELVADEHMPPVVQRDVCPDHAADGGPVVSRRDWVPMWTP